MKLIRLVLALYLMIVMTSCAATVRQKEELVKYDFQGLKGDWELVVDEINGSCPVEWVGPYRTGLAGFARIRQGTIYTMEYPCQLISKYSIRIEGDTLFGLRFNSVCERLPSPDGKMSGNPLRMIITKDTITLTSFDFVSRDAQYYVYIQYARKQLDSEIAEKLITDTINPNCLIGTWRLETSYDSEYDGNGIVDYDFAFQPEKKLEITADNLSTRFESNNMLKLNIEGEIQPFRIDHIGTELTLMPLGEWVSGDPDIRFDDEGKWKEIYYTKID